MVRKISRRALLISCTSGLLAACSFGQAGMTPYGVAVSGEGNTLRVTRQATLDGGYLATVESPRGIGQATVTWWGNTSPHHLSFQLELAALEQFSLEWPGYIVQLGVNTSDHSTFMTAREPSGREFVVTPDSSYWMEVKAMPPDAAGFTVVAPEAFHTAWPPVWGIAWVDYFR